MIRLPPAVFLAVLFACTSPPGTPVSDVDPTGSSRALGSFVFAFWNVENLFDTDDDPENPGDDEYLPAAGWTPELYATKREHLAEVIAAVRPHVIGMAEVENRRVLVDLFAEPQLHSLDYSIVHVDSPDKRGIDLALAYRAPFRLSGPDPVHLHGIEKADELPTRGVLEVRLDVDGAPLFVLVNHWPSRGGDRDGAFRRVAGTTVRAVVDRIVADEAAVGREADVLVVGDLNDDPFDPSVVDALGAVRSRNAVVNRENVRHLFNPSWAILGEPDLGTLYYNPEWTWNVFDQAIVSRGLLDERGFAFVEGSLAVHAPDALRDHYRRPRWFRKGRGGEWSTGYSDHFLVHGRLVLHVP